MNWISLEQRFWARVNMNGPIPSHVPELGKCWVWTGTFNGARGVLYIDKTHRIWRAYRVAVLLATGSSPALSVLHKCDNPACVRLDHLFLGTQKDNIRDMIAKGRRRAYDRHGERNPRAKLTAAQVADIKARRARGETLASIAALFGIGPSQVHRIANGKSWQ